MSHHIISLTGHGLESGAVLTIEDLQRTLQRALDFLTEGLEGADRRYDVRVLPCPLPVLFIVYYLE